MGMNNPSDYAYFYNSDGGDRIYDADSMCDWLTPFFTTGVFNGSLFVTANDPANLGVSVGTGFVNIEGKVKHFYERTPLTLSLPHAQYDRIDTIVVQRNDTDRDFVLKVVTGTASQNPQITPPVRQGNIYEMVLASIYVRAGESEITQAEITDMRPYEDVCGWVTATVTEMDFSQFAAQFTSQFGQWFENLQYVLDGDVAGHLQNEIDNITGGSIFAITTTEPSLLGQLVTITDENDNTFSGYFDLTGKCLIKGVYSTGNVTISSTDGEKTAAQIINIQYYSAYAVGLMFWNAVVSLSTESTELYGKTITVTNTTTQTVENVRFNSTGHATYVAHSPGVYVFSTVYASVMASTEVEITDEGEYSAVLSLWTAIINVSTPSEELYGKTIRVLFDGTEINTFVFSNDGHCTFNVYREGVYTLQSQGITKTVSEDVNVTAETTYNVRLVLAYIYGVEWDGTATTLLSRTDDAVGFINPVPAVGESDIGSSPFDSIYPWSDIRLVEDANCGWLVEYPKFYYKIEKTGTKINIRISNTELAGYYICPAHRNMGDGKGERDVIYLGATFCNKDTYKSEFKDTAGSGDGYYVKGYAAELFSAAKGLGDGVYPMSFSALLMLQLLYIVEYADWDSQKIGNGGYTSGHCGRTSVMAYHTGYVGTNSIYEGWTRYRYLEFPWGDAGSILSEVAYADHSSVVSTPTLFLQKDISKNIPYTLSECEPIANTVANGGKFITGFDVAEIQDYGYVLVPSEFNSGSSSTYCPDEVYTGTAGGSQAVYKYVYCPLPVVVYTTGDQYKMVGLFSLNMLTDVSSGGITCRLMKLP